MPILVATKLLFGNYMYFMPIYHIKKIPSKNIIFWTYMGIRILPITLSFLVQSRIFLYMDAQEMIIYKFYQISCFLDGWGAYLN